jgi:hypothetical protein
MDQPEIRYCMAADGVRLAYYVMGEGPALVRTSGFPSHLTGAWEMPGMAQNTRVLATVILASRIAAKAGAGEILVSDTVRGLLSGKGFVFGDRGETMLKGFDEGVRLWDVQWQEDTS